MADNAIKKLMTDQLSVWPEASSNFRSLRSAKTKSFNIGGVEVLVQFNPSRIASSTAEIDEKSLASRPCFLCLENRPKEQIHLMFEGRKGRRYRIQVNPFPIFPDHLVIARDRHVEQSIWHCYVDMLDLARKFSGFTIFYNGPCSGASAPDHMHFQACPRGMMPLEKAVEASLKNPAEEPLMKYLTDVQDAKMYLYEGYCRGLFVLSAKTSKSMAKLFYRLLDSLPPLPGEKEPRFNLFTWFSEGEYRSLVILRGNLRSHHYFSTDSDHLTMSPGCADMCGVFIAPREEDFNKITKEMLAEMVDEVTIPKGVESRLVWRLTRSQESLEVGILSSDEISFEIISDGAGPQKVSCEDGRINYNGVLYDELLFDAVTPSSLFAEPTFIIHNVVIGKDFHWERSFDQKFAGSLKFIVEDGKVVAVNIVGIEDYLLSVISSEMRPGASLEFLKAHAVISRSWVLSQIARRRSGENRIDSEMNGYSSSDELIRWWDHSDHRYFDVCADDHCQRYQGLSKAIGETSRLAVDETWGEVLTYKGEICDARFSKCCGGRTEKFSSAWDDKDYPYLASVEDGTDGEIFCNTSDEKILSQVLNDYDLETRDFFEWKEEYTVEEISGILRERTGIDFGTLKELVPLERGESGRITRLLVKGDKAEKVIGKELMIRRALSRSHLKSSAFTPVFRDGFLTLEGRGWGHGVGLCQIGAAVMATKGYSHEEILRHYYPGTEIERL